MGRAHAMLSCVLIALALGAPAARADSIDDQVASLGRGRTSKVRIAALVALTSTADARALAAMCTALGKDGDANVRLVAVSSIGKVLATTKVAKLRTDGIAALKAASTADRDRKVRAAATTVLTGAAGPAVLIHVEAATDQTKRAAGALSATTAGVRGAIGKPGYVTSWPGGLPTRAQLTARGAKAFVVASSVTSVVVTKRGAGNQIACSVQVRVAPWSGRDVAGGEHWVADKAATSTGSATILASTSPRATELAIGDCVAAVAEELAGKKIVPFLKKVAGKP